jgi:DNA primase
MGAPSTAIATAERVDAVLEDAAEFFESFLWSADATRHVRERERWGLEAQTLRAHQVGYAPSGWGSLAQRLAERGHSQADLTSAGIALESERGHAHVQLRSRIIFPVRDAQGRLLGFSGLATHPGPSWPQWLTSPESELYRRSSALFGIYKAAPAIARLRRAVVVSDCDDAARRVRRTWSRPRATSSPEITWRHWRS